MDGMTAQAPVPVFDRKRDLALYPDDALFIIPAGRLLLWGITFDVHEARPYTVAAVKHSALFAGGGYVASAKERWDRIHALRADNPDLEAQVAAELARDDERRAVEQIEWSQLHPSRNEAIVAMRGNGMTLEAIGNVFGLSKGRVGQLLAKAERAEQRLREREAAAELHRQVCAEMDALAVANRAAQAKAKRARRVVDLTGVEPASNWRTPADEWLAIGMERAG